MGSVGSIEFIELIEFIGGSQPGLPRLKQGFDICGLRKLLIANHEDTGKMPAFRNIIGDRL